MSEIRSAAASSIHAARRSHSARQRYQTPRRRHGNRSTSANHNPSPSISPGNCRSAGAPRTRTPSNFLHRAMFFFFSLSSSAHSVQWEENVFLEPFKPGSLESINGLICLLLKSESKAAGHVPRYSGQAAQTPRGGEKGCVTAPCLMTIVDLQLGPS